MLMNMFQTARNAYGLMLVVCIAVLATGDVWLSHARYEISRQADHDLKERQALTAKLSQLNLQLASMTRPDKLRSAAKKLDMAPPSPVQVIRP